jgi:hypothetical protein
MNRHLNNQGEECKAVHIKWRVIVGGGGGMKRVKEGEDG